MVTRLVAAVLLASMMVAPSSATDTPSADTAATREVIAEGSAAIGTDGFPAARKAAIAQAQRNAVQQVTSVYVSAQTLTRNYRLVRDQIVTHAEGFIAADTVLRETIAEGEVRVTLRVRVALPMLAKAVSTLQAANLGRIHLVVETQGMTNFANFDLKPIEMTLEKTLTDVGFVMVSSDDTADITIKVLHQYAHSNEVAPPATLGDAHAQLTATATWTQIGETITSLSTKSSITQVPKGPGFTLVRDAMIANLVPRLADLLTMTAKRDSVPVRIEAGQFDSPAQAEQFAKALAARNGVSNIRRLLYENGNSLWQCTILRDRETDTALALEEAPAFLPFHLKVLTETPFRIVAATNGRPPRFSAEPPRPFVLPDTETVTVPPPAEYQAEARLHPQPHPRR